MNNDEGKAEELEVHPGDEGGRVTWKIGIVVAALSLEESHDHDLCSTSSGPRFWAKEDSLG
jgi:hypothetical protein